MLKKLEYYYNEDGEKIDIIGEKLGDDDKCLIALLHS